MIRLVLASLTHIVLSQLTQCTTSLMYSLDLSLTYVHYCNELLLVARTTVEWVLFQ